MLLVLYGPLDLIAAAIKLLWDKPLNRTRCVGVRGAGNYCSTHYYPDNHQYIFDSKFSCISAYILYAITDRTLFLVRNNQI